MTPTADAAPVLEVRDLRFSYPGGEPVLDGVSCAIGPGERVAILGGNGAGKSTLLLHLNGILTPASGRVAVAGMDVGPETAREVRRRVGLVFQDPDDQLFLPTLLEDVAFGPLNHGHDPAAAEDAARDILGELGLEHAADRAAHHLSGGEKRLAALATALVLRPEVLAIDEPTADLDARARRRVFDTLRRRPETLVIATHDLDFARALCTRAILLDGGSVVADGETRDLLGDERLLRTHGLTAPLWV